MGLVDEKNSVTPLDDKSNCRLWRVQIKALCGYKDLGECLIKKNPHDKSLKECMKHEGFKKKASKITVDLLTNRVLRVVLRDISNPCRTLQKLDEQYGSKYISA